MSNKIEFHREVVKDGKGVERVRDFYKIPVAPKLVPQPYKSGEVDENIKKDFAKEYAAFCEEQGK